VRKERASAGRHDLEGGPCGKCCLASRRKVPARAGLAPCRGLCARCCLIGRLVGALASCNGGFCAIHHGNGWTSSDVRWRRTMGPGRRDLLLHVGQETAFVV